MMLGVSPDARPRDLVKIDRRLHIGYPRNSEFGNNSALR